MKRFKWRLQRVLDIKQKEEQIKRAELFDLTEQLSQVRGELFMQKRILEDLLQSLAEKPLRDRWGQQEFLMTYSAANDAIIKALEDKTQALTVKQKEKVSEIMTIKKFNKGLERLRSEAKMEFIKEQEKLEQKESDERVTSDFTRKIMKQNERLELVV